jgi:hypothetical protein
MTKNLASGDEKSANYRKTIRNVVFAHQMLNLTGGGSGGDIHRHVTGVVNYRKTIQNVVVTHQFFNFVRRWKWR